MAVIPESWNDSAVPDPKGGSTSAGQEIEDGAGALIGEIA